MKSKSRWRFSAARSRRGASVSVSPRSARSARRRPRQAPGLALADVDRVFEEVAGTRGRGSTAARVQQLRDLMRRATPDEQDFLVRLLYGEIRQGALESVITDAVARAAELPAARVRRAVMMAGGLGPVARVALAGVGPDLSQFTLRVLFDCLLVDAQDLTDDPLSRRAEVLVETTGGRSLVHRVCSPRPAAAAAFVDDARRAGHEGVMAKSLEAGYAAGSRGAAWLKIKQATTLDLVVLAAEWGSGRRRGWLSNLHLGARDRARNGFVMLGKTFKGLTDALLAWQTRRFLELETGRDRYTVFVRPELVVEVAFNDVPGQPAVSGRRRPAVRPRQALPRRQDGRRGGHHRDGAGDPSTGDAAIGARRLPALIDRSPR